jgi:hypothetical protein
MGDVSAPALAGREAGQIVSTRKSCTPKQIVRRLELADQMPADGNDVETVRRELGVSEQVY